MKLLKQYDPESYLQKETETLILRHEPSLHTDIDVTGLIILPIAGDHE